MRFLPTAIKNIFKKPFTYKYPYKPIILPQGFRGDFSWDRNKCIFCEVCERVCPAEAINVEKEKKNYEWDSGKCIFCAQCEENCPTKAIHFIEKMTQVDTERKIRKYQ
jgi:formate hydrogenlyase subunit 6/NADH:ubiquinone oxidoreductase subunit I